MGQMQIATYFGFFAQSFFTAMAQSMTRQLGKPVNLDSMDIHASTIISLGRLGLQSVVVPALTEKTDIPFVLAFTTRETETLEQLAEGNLQRLMEEAVGAAMEPVNFLTKSRNSLRGLRFQRNVPGLIAQRLGGTLNFTVAEAHLRGPGPQPLLLRLLIGPQALNRIEERAQAKPAQLALFSVLEGAYVCRPQWAPTPTAAPATGGKPAITPATPNASPPGMAPPAPEAMAQAQAPALLAQTFLMLHSGLLPPKMFRQPVAFSTQVATPQTLHALGGQAENLHIVRLRAEDKAEMELYVVLPASSTRELMRLSQSGQARFVGDFFRILLGEAAQVWQSLLGQPMQWRTEGVRELPPAALEAVTKRTAEGGLLLQQRASLSDGALDWLVALPPATWGWMQAATAQVCKRADITPATNDAATLLQATGWGQTQIPWEHMTRLAQDNDLWHLTRRLAEAGFGPAHLVAVAETLSPPQRERWLTAMPVTLRDKTQAHRLTPGEAPRRLVILTNGLVALCRTDKLPESPLRHWLTLFAEFHYRRRQDLLQRHLPLRHLIYGLDRQSLFQLIRDESRQTVAEMLTAAEYMVQDQVRRACSPRFALGLLEDVAARRPRTSALTAQEATLRFYRRTQTGMVKGRYLVRETAGLRLQTLLRELDA